MGTPSFDSPLDANYFSALDYIFSIDDIQSILRCMVHVDDKTRGSYEAQVEELIPSYGKCNDTTIVPTYIAGCGWSLPIYLVVSTPCDMFIQAN